MFEAKTDRKVALFLADGCEEIEALTVADLLYRAGIPCVTVSINQTPVVCSSHNVTIVADTTVGLLDFDAFDMLVLPGGMPGMLNLKACKPLSDALIRFHREGKPVAAICASPSILAELGLLRGKRSTCNPSFESVLVDNGADLVHENAVTTDRIITSRGMGTAIPFGLEIIPYYLGKETADALGSNILYYQ